MPRPAIAEFYQYTDRDGTVHFVEDKSAIPPAYRGEAAVRKDPHDDLPDEERARLLEEARRAGERRSRENSARDEADARRRREEARREESEKVRASLTTPVVIRGNQVFVPVTLSYGGVSAEEMLLLDTGATTTMITFAVAERLRIGEMESAAVQVAGGKVLRAGHARLSAMTVGPIVRSDMDVIVLRQRGNGLEGGLLGMNFLRGLNYRIDFANQVITWEAEGQQPRNAD
jgi:clan AA aspartic protease (TIGR02281 family)